MSGTGLLHRAPSLLRGLTNSIPDRDRQAKRKVRTAQRTGVSTQILGRIAVDDWKPQNGSRANNPTGIAWFEVRRSSQRERLRHQCVFLAADRLRNPPSSHHSTENYPKSCGIRLFPLFERCQSWLGSAVPKEFGRRRDLQSYLDGL